MIIFLEKYLHLQMAKGPVKSSEISTVGFNFISTISISGSREMEVVCFMQQQDQHILERRVS